MTQDRLPDPRFDLEVYGGSIFVDSKGSEMYNATKAYTQFLSFSPQKEFGSSPLFGIRILYPGKNRFWLGMDLAYVRSIAVNRYSDIYGQYDLEVTLRNASYQFIMRYSQQGKHALTWYMQGGVGPSYLIEKSRESITSSLAYDTFADLQIWEASEETFGWSLSLEGGLRGAPGRLTMMTGIGYRYSIHFSESESYVRGFTAEIGLGLNLLK